MEVGVVRKRIIEELDAVPKCGHCHRTIKVGWWMWQEAKSGKILCNTCFWEHGESKEQYAWGKRVG